MKIELSCSQCGGTKFDYPVKFTNTSVIKCATCGHAVGTVGEIQRQLLERLTGPPPEPTS